MTDTICGTDFKRYICWNKTFSSMFEFQQYLGFLLFLTIFTMGFWLMIFLINFIFYWVGGASYELWKERRAKKKLEQGQ
jgi:uncharacterized membrane protein